MCVSYISAICTLCLLNSCVTSICTCLEPMWSGFRVTTVGLSIPCSAFMPVLLFLHSGENSAPALSFGSISYVPVCPVIIISGL